MATDEPAPLPPTRRGAAQTGFRGLAGIGLLTWMLGFALVAALGRAATPWPDDFAVTPKLHYLRDHATEIDTLFLGKSNVFRSYIPSIIDARMAEAGHPMRSFNLGGPGMSDAEIDHLLRTVLDLDGLQLKYVFIEAPDWHSRADTNLDTNRAVHWHTPRQAWRMLANLERDSAGTLASGDPAGPSDPWGWRTLAQRVGKQLELLWLNATSYGQGQRILAHLLGETEPQPLSAEDVGRDRGYQALDDLRTEEMRRRREAFLQNVGSYADRVAGISAGNAEPYDLEHYDLAALRSQMDLVRAAGAEPIYMVPPGMQSSPHAFALVKDGHLSQVHAFNLPDRYPALYRLDRRYDGHLNRRGAQEFSRLFARTVAPFLPSHP